MNLSVYRGTIAGYARTNSWPNTESDADHLNTSNIKETLGATKQIKSLRPQEGKIC